MDNFFTNYFRPKQRELGTVPSSTSDAASSTDSSTNTGGSYGTHAVNVRSADVALTVAAWHRGVELRAKTMSQLLIEYQKRTRQGNYVADVYGASARLNYLLQKRPNPLMTASVLMQQAEINKIMAGNAFIYIDRDEYGEVQALWLCSSGSYNQMTDEFILTYNSHRGPVSLAAPAADVIHIPNTYRTPQGYLGMPTLVFAARALSIAATNDAQTLDNAAKGGKMKLLLQEDKQPTFGLGRASQTELRKITQALEDDMYDHDVMMLNNVASVTPISQSAQQMELLSSRQFSVAEIARLLGVPKAMLMDDSNSSYKTPEAATQEFLLRTIQPMIREWEDELDSKLLGPSEFGKHRFHLCERALHRLDPRTQADLDKIRLETGVSSVNELRAQYDMPPVAEGDRHYISTNLAELGSEKLSGGAMPNVTEEGGQA